MPNLPIFQTNLKFVFFFSRQRVLLVVVYLIIKRNEKWYPIPFQVDVHASGSKGKGKGEMVLKSH